MATPEAHQLSESEEVQLRVFTRWVNWKLEKTGVEVGSLEVGLESGVKLLQLLEVLAPGKKLPKYQKKPSKASHKTQNLSTALSFITQTEKIDLDNIEASDITDQNLPKILSLVRSLILHYHLKEPKEALLEFLNAALPGRDISNFSTNWRDGSNLAALVNYCKPDLVKSATQEQNGTLQNITNVMDLAEKVLHVPQLLMHEDLATESPDELCVMIYISCFIIGTSSPVQHALLSWIRHRIPNQKISNFSDDWKDGIALAALVNAVSMGQFSEYQKMSTKGSKGLDNCRGAMEAAKDILGIEKRFEPENFHNPKFDTLKRMAYLVQFRNIKLPPKVLNLHIPEKVALGEMVCLDIECYVENSEAISASAEGNEVGQVPVEIDVLSSVHHKYRIRFSAKEEDMYTLSVHVGENRVRGSPFHISLTHPKKTVALPQSEKVKCGELLYGDAGKTARLPVDHSSAGKGMVTAECVGQEKGAVEVKVGFVREGHSEITLTPKEDLYTLSVYFEGVEVHGSPFRIDLRPTPSQPEEVVVFETPSGSLNTGEEIAIVFDTSRAGQGRMTASCAGEKVGDVPIEVTKHSHLKSTVKFTPEEKDIYSISVFWAGEHIRGSPFAINLIPKDQPNPSKVKMLSLVNEPIMFQVNTAGAGKGTLDVKVRNPAKKTDHQLEIKPTAKDSPIYDVTYTPTVPGKHKLYLTWAKEAVPNSPVVIHVTSPQPFIYGSPVSIRVDVKSRRKDMRAFALPAGKPTSSQLKAKVNKISHGHFEIVVEPKHTGIYYVHVFSKDKEIKESPFVVNYTKESKPEACVVHGLVDVGYVEVPIKFTVDTTKAGRGKLAIQARGKAECKGVVMDNEDGTYSAEFTPTSEGDYEVDMRFAGAPIPGDPFKIVIHKQEEAVDTVEDSKPDEGDTVEVSITKPIPEEPPFHLELGDPTQCRMDGDGIHSAQINKLSKFSISTENAGPGNLGVSVEGEEKTLEPTITTIDSNHCEVSYLPTKGGVYKVFVRWSGVNIPGSPFEVACIDPSLVNVVERITESFMGRSVKFTVTSPLETQDEKQVTIVAHSDDHVVPGQVEKVDELTYLCTINLPAPGTYSVHICWGGVHINGGPWELKVTPAPTPEDSTVKAAELESGSLGVDVSGPSQAFKYGELTASVINEVTKEKLPVTVKNKSQSHCTVGFKPIPSEGIQYTLSIKYDGEGISGSPFAFIGTDASQCTIEGKGLRFAKTGEWNHFTVHAKNEGMGELKVHIEGEGEVVEPLIAANEMHYRVDYMPKRRGIYTIAVKCGFEHVPNSPFKVYCSDPTKFCIKEHVKDAPTWIPIKFDVETQQTPVEWEKLSVVARSKHKEDIHGEVKQEKGGKYKCFITISETGKYVIHVRCNGFEISESPFRVCLMPTPVPENVQVYGPGLKDGSVGQEGTFTISVAGAGHGYLSFRVEGPKGAFKIHMKHHPDKKDAILAQYNPLHAGKYTISVLWAGVHVPGSPFSVSILEAGEQDEET